MSNEALAKQEQGEQEENRLIQQRDHAHEIIDKLCDAVLGFDRQEWSSAYFFEDAVNEVEEKMWQLAKQEQRSDNEHLGEPVASAWMYHGEMVNAFPWPPNDPRGCDDDKYWEGRGYTSEPLYSTPPQRKPLTNDQIVSIRRRDVIQFARAIEAAHGIKEEL